MGPIAHFLDNPGRTWAESPLPAWATSATLLSLYKRPSHPPLPRPLPLALFATAFLVSGYLTYDSPHISDGSGTTAAWSLLYLFSKDARNALRLSSYKTTPPGTGTGALGVWRRIGPLGLLGLVGVNAVTHSWVWWKGEKGKGPVYRGGGEAWSGDI
ncbi:hypothetical protein DFH27DRAFT_155825 [Peziza echinospora]|nr:hypothetical protein DFH27DRAFT_155825 [Peziza echinospora]